MPGLFGVVRNKQIYRPQFEEASKILNYHSWYKQDDIFEDMLVFASRVHLDVLGEHDSPNHINGIFCWSEGEAYNLDSLKNQKNKKLSLSVIEAYLNDYLECFLSQVDGCFSAVLYDKNKETIFLISDRNGLKPLYFYHKNGHFAWSSEIKFFLGLPYFTPSIRKEAFDCFLGLGHLIGDMTWFHNVHLLDPASILKYNNATQELTIRKYWEWDNIKPLAISFEEATEHLGVLIDRAINKRIYEEERIGISLSGGLDSRAILAALPDNREATCYTFGKPGCLDVDIAKQISCKKGCEHYIYGLDSANWLDGRFWGVWKTDGMFSLLHMHALGAVNNVKQYIDININGYLGDAVIGGSYLKGKSYDMPINEEIASLHYGSFYKYCLFDKYKNISKIDPYLVENRGRRFINPGTLLWTDQIEQRKPYMDNNIIEFVYGLPDIYRVNSSIYNKALLLKYPEFYENIPYSKTGKPISDKSYLYNKISKKIHSAFLRLGLVENNLSYTNYPMWIRDSKYSIIIKNILTDNKALIRNYVPFNINQDILEPHFNKEKNNSEKICRLLTAEVWMQQVFNNRYFSESDSA